MIAILKQEEPDARPEGMTGDPISHDLPDSYTGRHCMVGLHEPQRSPTISGSDFRENGRG